MFEAIVSYPADIILTVVITSNRDILAEPMVAH